MVEPGKESDPALERAVSLAINNQAKLTVVSLASSVSASIGLPEGSEMLKDLQRATVDRHKQSISALIEPFEGKIDIESRVLIGTPFLEIIREVLRNGHDMVIKSPESLDWLDRLFSSNDKHLLRKCPCPVWVVRSDSGSFGKVMACVDVGDSYPPKEMETRQALNQTVMELASSLAVSEFADLHVVYAWEALGESRLRSGAFMQEPEKEVDAYVERIRVHNKDLFDDFIQNVRENLGTDVADYLKPSLHMPKGGARKVIPQLAKELNADCVVMGTVARTGIPGLIMGNTAETILEQLECSVLAIKPPGFDTPVTPE